MSMPAVELVSAKPLWLSQSIARVLKLPKELPPNLGVEGLAIQLLRSIEAEQVPVPTVCVTRKGSIRLVWEHHHRQLVVCVTGPETFRCGGFDGGVPLPMRTIRRDRVQEMRTAIAWLTPFANTTEMATYLKRGDR